MNRTVRKAKVTTIPIRPTMNVGISVPGVPRPAGATRRGAKDPAKGNRGKDRHEAAEGHHDAAGHIRSPSLTGVLT
jgi:hypothetical protein